MRRLAWLGVLAAFALPAGALTLTQTWESAAGRDPQYAAARAQRDAGQAQRVQATALWRPSVGLEANVSLASAGQQVRGASFAAPGFGSTSGVAFDTSVRAGLAQTYGVQLRQPLLDRDRTAQTGQLTAAATLAELGWQAAGQGLMLRSAQLYLEAALAQRSVQLWRQLEEAAQRAGTEAQDRFQIGDRPVTAVHEAQARLQSVRAQRLMAESELAQRRARLADLLGQEPPPELAVPAAGVQPEGTLDQWLQRAGQDSLQVQQARVQAELAALEVARSAGAWAPTLDVIARAGRTRISGNGSFGDASQQATQAAIGVQLNVPLSTDGLRSARHEESVALQHKAEAGVEAAQQAARHEARAAWLDLQTGTARLAALEAGRTASLARLDATQVGLAAGDRTTLDLLNAQSDAMSAQLSLLQERVRQALAQLRLQAAAGSLTPDHLGRIDGQLDAR